MKCPSCSKRLDDYGTWIALNRKAEQDQRVSDEHLEFLLHHREDLDPDQRAFVEECYRQKLMGHYELWPDPSSITRGPCQAE